MRLHSPSVRARLTLWHASVLTLVVGLFSAGTLLVVWARFDRMFEGQLSPDLATVEKVYRGETGDPGELAQRMRSTRFEGREGQTGIYRHAGWPPTRPTPDRIRAAGDATHRITVARDETPLRRTLWTLAAILGTGIPCAIGLAIAGGYFLAGRVLAPVDAMADTARRITAESLSARLPVE